MLLSTNNIILENPKEEGASKKKIVRFNNELDDTVKENKSYQELSDNEIIKQNKITNKDNVHIINKTSQMPIPSEKLVLFSTIQTQTSHLRKDDYLLKSNITKDNEISFNNEGAYYKTEKSGNDEVQFSNSFGATISYREVWNYFTSLFFSKEKDIPEVSESENKKKCCLFKLFSKDIDLEDELQKDFNFYLFTYNLEVDLQDKQHYQIIHTILLSFNIKDCDITGINSFLMEVTKTTNRSISILTLILIMFIIDRHPSYLREKCDSKENKEKAISLFAFFDSLAFILITLSKEKILNLYYIKNKSVTNTMNEFYMGLIYLCNNDFGTSNIYQHNSSLNDIFFNKILSIARERPSSVLWKYNFFKDKYPEVKDSVSGSLENLNSDR